MPLLLSMMQKLLAKGLTIQVVETHQTWCGQVVEARMSPDNRLEVRVHQQIEEGVFTRTGFTVMQPERWKLGKNPEGQWCLWPPRARSRRK